MRRALMILAALLLVATPLAAAEVHDAAREGDLAAVRAIVDADRTNLDARNERNETPVHIASLAGHADVVRYLIEEGVPVDVGDNEGSTPLECACIGGHLEIVEYLISKGADVRHEDQNHMTPLLFAAYNGRPEIVALLKTHGAALDVRTRNGSTPLHGAAFANDLETVRVLLESGADVNARNDALYTPLLSAVAGQGDLELVRLLAEHGADLYDRQNFGETALMYAARRGDRALVEYLMDQGLGLGAKSDYGARSAVHEAAGWGSVEVLEYFLDQGADIEDPTVNGWTPLFWAATRGQTEAARVLVERGAEIDVVDREGSTPLMRSALLDSTAFFELLLEHGADPDIPLERDGRTIVHVAAIYGQADLVRLAAEHGASLDVQDLSGSTPADYAARYAHPDVAEILKSRGARAPKIAGTADVAELLDRPLSDGEAVLWYLGHCGWAMKTRNHFLVFDYWKQISEPPSPSLANGWIDPSEIPDLDVCVFVSHEHADHYDERIFDLAGDLDNITYVYGFNPELVPQHRENGYPGPVCETVGPREHRMIDGMSVRTIEANDAGVGYLIEVDGLVVYFAGDHAGWADGEREGYFSEIDYLDEFVDGLDIAFLNVTGCHAHDPDRLREGNVYTIRTLRPKLMIPTHAGLREYVYADAVEELAAEAPDALYRYPENPGDSFLYRDGVVR